MPPHAMPAKTIAPSKKSKSDIKTKEKKESSKSTKHSGSKTSTKKSSDKKSSAKKSSKKKSDEKSSKKKSDEKKSTVSDIDLEAYIESKKFLDDHNIKISTITINCTLGIMINIDSFAKYVVLDEEGIVMVKHGDRKNPATNRTIVPIKKKLSKRTFFNQVTILMKPVGVPDGKYINIKVFNNGSLHFTGCKDICDFINVTNTLINILVKGTDIKDKSKKAKHIKFVGKSDSKKIGIFGIKIRMINSNFKLNYKIDRKKLAAILRKNHGTRTTDRKIGYVDFKHKPNGGHSCVNIKYRYDDLSSPSIFVFQTGAVIITGAKTLYQIISAYHYIHLILNEYLLQIKIIDLDPKLVNAEIKLFLQKKKTQNLLLGSDSSIFSDTNILSSDSDHPKTKMRAFKAPWDVSPDDTIRSDKPFTPKKMTVKRKEKEIRSDQLYKLCKEADMFPVKKSSKRSGSKTLSKKGKRGPKTKPKAKSKKTIRLD